MSRRPITIIGGGLAGLALGIGLRRQNVPVILWEAGRYPRHRVCGEFISGEGLNSLSRLGLREKLIQAEAGLATQAAFFSEQSLVSQKPLPTAAWCLSRYHLDAMLAEELRSLGGDLKEGTRWVDTMSGEGIVRASGRRPQAMVDGWRWIGLKVHAREVPLESDLEMHFRPDGYVGVCRLPQGEVNICGLLRTRQPLPELAKDWKRILAGVPGSPLARKLSQAVFDSDSFCSVAAIDLSPRRGLETGECSIGDALTMIPPVTGNGMSMAFESAELALEPLLHFSGGHLSWNETVRAVAGRCDERFSRRLKWARRLQSCLLQRQLRPILFFSISRFPQLWVSVFSKTR